MADNYLEKQMDDYRSGRLKTSKPAVKASALTSLVRGQRLLFTDYLPFRQLIPALVEAGAKVAFLSSDTKAATAFAQQSGAQFHPSPALTPATVSDALSSALALISRRWGAPTALLNADPSLSASLQSFASAHRLPLIDLHTYNL